MGKKQSEEVSFYVCYPAVIEVNDNDLWSWKYVKGEISPLTSVLIISKYCSFEELYKEVKKEVKIDTSVYDFEMKVLPPVPKPFPMKLDSDDMVKKFLTMCGIQQEYLLVSLKEKAKVNEVDKRYIDVHVDGNVEAQVPIFEVDVGNDDAIHVDGNVGDQVPNVEMDVGKDHVVHVDDRDVLEDTIPSVDELMNDICVEETNIEEDCLLGSLGEDVFIEANEDRPNEDTPNEDRSNEDTLNPTTPIAEDMNRGSKFIGLCHVRIPEDLDIRTKDVFVSKTLLIFKVEMLAVKYHFEFTTKAFTRELYVVQCTGKECKWRLRASRLANSTRFQVVKYASRHTCPHMRRLRDHKHASYKLVGRHYLSKFKDVDLVYSPRDIRHDFLEEFGYEINYDKALKARRYGESLLRGYPKMSYGCLPKFFHRLEVTNPGTKTDIKTIDGSDEFLYCYMALGASIRGFEFMRPVVCVDATHLKSRYKGVLLVATCEDGNGQIFPLAWAVVDLETKESWTWFFEHLKEITSDCEKLAIISDRADSIQQAFKKVFKKAHHGFCIYHIQKNLRSHFPGRGVASKFIRLAKAYTEATFNRLWDEVDALCSEEKNLGTYLVKEDFPYWARCNFNGIRYNIMTSNNAESINSLLIPARKSSIIGLFERIREVLQKWFADRAKESREWKELSYVLTPKAEE